jgi:RNA recognition motif-containing protein
MSKSSGAIFGSPVKGSTTTMASLFSSSSKEMYARAEKPKEFTKKRSEVTEKLDDEEMKLVEEKEVRKAAKKAKRVIKPMPAAKIEKVLKKRGMPAVLASKSTVVPPAPKSPKTSSDDEFTKPASSQSTDKDDRTVFLGNLPLSESIKSITKMCNEFGEVESVRLRSVPVAGTAVDEAGNQNLVKKICVNKKNFGTQKGSLNAYVVFTTRASVLKVLSANNRLIESTNKKGESTHRHLRVDLMKPTLFPPARTIFIGALPHYADEEEVRAHFATVLPNGQDDIENIRLVRDAETLVGKGIGYLLLKNRDAVMKALSLHAAKYRKRWELRVTVCGKRTKRVDASAHLGGTAGPDVTGSTRGEKRKRDVDGESNETKGKKGVSDDDSKKQRWRDLDPEEQARRKAISDNGNAAAKRLTKKKLSQVAKSLKTTNTRKRVLQDKGQVKKEKGRKGKRLGGNVKKAMKAQKAGAGGAH